MESDLKRVARLEYLKLRHSKQSEKVDAVKVLHRIQIELETHKHQVIVHYGREILKFKTYRSSLKLIIQLSLICFKVILLMKNLVNYSENNVTFCPSLHVAW